MWKTICSGRNTAKKNMEIDKFLLENLPFDGDPILHLYEWEGPSATFGYFIDPKKHLSTLDKVNWARRPTGGGLVFHIWDFAFSVLIPSNHHGYSNDTMQNYKFINDAVLQAVENFSTQTCNLLPHEPDIYEEKAKKFCFGKPTKYDVMFRGKKIAGSAQRCKRNGYLHQGSISLVAPDIDLLYELLPKEVARAIEQNTFALLPSADLEEGRKEMAKHLQKTLFAL